MQPFFILKKMQTNKSTKFKNCPSVPALRAGESPDTLLSMFTTAEDSQIISQNKLPEKVQAPHPRELMNHNYLQMRHHL